MFLLDLVYEQIKVPPLDKVSYDQLSSRKGPTYEL